MSMHLTELWIHPVKSMQGQAVAAAQVGAQGLAGDRQWLLADERGRFITAREVPELLLWQPMPQPADASGHACLQLRAPDGQVRSVSAADYTHPAPVAVWRDAFGAWGGPAQTDAWLSERLGRACRLFYLGQCSQRALAGQPGQPLSFADSAPFLLCSQASLAQLNRDMQQLPGREPVTMRRFRPNLVVDALADGLAPYAEDGWTRLRIGALEFSLYKHCTRCKIVNLDPHTAQLSPAKEPLQTLARTHKLPAGVCFGVHLVAHGTGQLRVGDKVELLA